MKAVQRPEIVPEVLVEDTIALVHQFNATLLAAAEGQDFPYGATVADEPVDAERYFSATWLKTFEDVDILVRATETRRIRQTKPRDVPRLSLVVSPHGGDPKHYLGEYTLSSMPDGTALLSSDDNDRGVPDSAVICNLAGVADVRELRSDIVKIMQGEPSADETVRVRFSAPQLTKASQEDGAQQSVDPARRHTIEATKQVVPARGTLKSYRSLELRSKGLLQFAAYLSMHDEHTPGGLISAKFTWEGPEAARLPRGDHGHELTPRALGALEQIGNTSLRQIALLAAARDQTVAAEST